MFHFKQFSLSHLQSSMKVGTDAVLLGAWLPVPENCKEILEIGSGCGVISLMLAQRTTANITGIDMDEKSVKEAQKNAENSPWKNRVQFVQETAQDFAQKTTQKFDLIVSNPPFFENSLKSPKTNKNIAKHTDTLPLSILIQTINTLLSNTGQTGLILPFVTAEKFEILAKNNRLYATKKTYVSPTPTKKPNRMLMLFERAAKPCEEDSFVIRENGYTKEYCEFVKDYLKI